MLIYHALHVLKSVQSKLHKALIPNSDKELVIFISQCVLNILNCNIALTSCNTRKLRKHKIAHLELVDKHVSLSGKKRLIVQRMGFLLHLLVSVLPTLASFIAA